MLSHRKVVVIEAHDLSKTYVRRTMESGFKGILKSLLRAHYQSVSAVRDVSFKIQDGEMVGYIGPDGAGKSTTIKMLCGVLLPSGGTARVGGRDPFRDRVKSAATIGAVFGQRNQLSIDLPAAETYRFLRHVYEIPKNVFEDRLEYVRDLLQLSEFWDVAVSNLSLGQRMRANLGAALLHNPKVLFLDEPTVGMDLPTKIRFRTMLKEINRNEGVTVLLSSHDLGDIEELCSRIIVIDHGRLIFDGTIGDLRADFGNKWHMIVEFEPNSDGKHESEWISAEFPDVEAAITPGAHRIELRFDPRETPAPDLVARSMKIRKIRDLAINEPDIEEIISRIYQSDTGTAALP